MTGPKGQPTGALFGLANTLLKIIQEKKPTHIAAAFDRPEPTLREQKYKEYKAHRPKADEILIDQIKEAPNLFRAFGIPTFSSAGFEADDIIGTLAAKFGALKDSKIVILTGDLDLLQLVNKNTIVETPRRGLSDITEYDEEAVQNRFGVGPKQLADYKGLVGDTSDNIPGVPGIGPKTAAELISKFGTVENLCKTIGKNNKLAAKILPHTKTALLSKELALIKKDAPVAPSINDLVFKELTSANLVPYLQSLGFSRLIRRLTEPQETPRRKSSESTMPAHPPTTQTELALDPKLPSDPFIKISAWLLNPETGNQNLALLQRKYGAASEPGLKKILKAKISENGLEKVLNEIELPLVEILASMSRIGIGIDLTHLKNLDAELTQELGRLTEAIHQATGAIFNLNSPKQLADVIYDRLGLAQKKRTKTGQKSTSEETLAEIKDTHPVIPLILEYREAFKIKSTYVEPLITLGKESGRIHTVFNQTGAATGRIISEKPNLQNIPMGGRWAKPLRDCFVAKPGFTFLAFDYSQLELRLLAHTTRDPILSAAFREGNDIHRLTASKIFRIPPEKITEEMRRIGKTLNFGIIYGMGSRALARAAGISPKEAQIFIQEYFRTFPAVKPWQEKIKTQALTIGFVETENGRKRWFTPSNHPRFRGEIERMAINLPIQGLNADILKLAMIKTLSVLEAEKWFPKKAAPLLTIHDELLFEIADDIMSRTASLLKNAMETAYPISVPIIVQPKAGKSWGKMENLTP